MSRLVGYTADQIPYVWPKVEGYVQMALDRGSNYTLDEIFEGLCKREFQLWCSLNSDIEAAMVTAIQKDSKCTFCLLLTVGGTNMREWSKWLPEIEEWARNHGADEMRIYGRIGWAKALNFDIEWTKMSKQLWQQDSRKK